MDKQETILSFLFETPDVARGRTILEIREDLRKYSINQGFNLPPRINHRASIDYRGELQNVFVGQEYMECFDFGDIRLAETDRVRLHSIFRADGFGEFLETKRFQKIHKDIYDYVMKKEFYMVCCYEQPTKPPILFSNPHFSMHGGGEYHGISVDLSSEIQDYILRKQKEYGEPGPLSARQRYEARLKPGEKNLFID